MIILKIIGWIIAIPFILFFAVLVLILFVAGGFILAGLLMA
jgi:hypothetical protein